jgi:hypothetical protein
MNPELKELRRQIAKLRKHSPRRQLTPEIRQQAVVYVKSRLDHDETLSNIAREIGVSYSYAKGLLYDNNESDPECTTLVPVQITPDVDQSPQEPTLELVSPAGYRLQGLSFQQALEAMRVLS